MVTIRIYVYKIKVAVHILRSLKLPLIATLTYVIIKKLILPDWVHMYNFQFYCVVLTGWLHS